MLVLFISNHERNGGFFMNKQIISLLLGACLCTSLAGCGNADNNGGSVTKQKLLASKELGSDLAVEAKPIRVPGAIRQRNWNQHLASKSFHPGIQKCKAI